MRQLLQAKRLLSICNLAYLTNGKIRLAIAKKATIKSSQRRANQGFSGGRNSK
jgi:hypothetical protein